MSPRYLSLLAIPMFFVPLRAADLQVAGIPNFHQVAPHIFRGGQPTGESWSHLSKLGIKVVIDLRRDGEHSIADERRAVEGAGMRYVNVPMKGIVAPSDEHIAKILELFEASPAEPVFVHCRRGADRTGTVIACYRIAHDGWDTRRALAEAKSHGMNWKEFGMKHYIRDFQGVTEAAAREGEVPIPVGKP